MFFPLVLLVAILPGLVALKSWDLTPPGPLWGLRALAVLEGLTLDQVPAAGEIKPPGEAAALRSICFQPPLYAWLAALGMWLSADLDPLSSVLPSYVAGAIVVVLVYLHGRIWRGGGMGLAAALLVGFNPSLLLRMQEATPTSLALVGALGALLCYGCYERACSGSAVPWPWAGPLFWAMAGGFCLGLSLLAVAGFGLLVIPIVILHQFYLRAGVPSGPPARAQTLLKWLDWWRSSGAVDGVAALGTALLVALPWYLVMLQVHGSEVLAPLSSTPWGTSAGADSSLLARLFQLSPVTLPLGVYGAIRAIRLALIDEDSPPETVGGSLWVIWLAVAALAPTFWSRGPHAAMDLFLLVPLNLLAALTVADLVNRRVPIRALIGLAPATAMSVAWWASEDLKGAVDDLLHARANAATALGLHLALDLVLASIWLARWLERWARQRDIRQRQVLAIFLLTILAITVATGVREVVFRHSETNDLLTLRTMILRRNRDRPFELLAVVGSDTAKPPGTTSVPRPGSGERYSGGWLRFILRTALPHLPQQDIGSIDELLTLPQGQRLVIFTGAGERISYAVRSQLGLEAIHPGRTGVLDAYATAHHRSPRR
jgi:hypothetical protein